jgi:hypothetical protein
MIMNIWEQPMEFPELFFFYLKYEKNILEELKAE